MEGKDFAVAFADNVNPGTTKATLTGMGNYTGARDVAFRIVEKTQTTSQSSHNGSQVASQAIRAGTPRTADGNVSHSVLQALSFTAAACFMMSRKQRR